MASNPDSVAHAICPADYRDRLDKALPALLPSLSRSEARRLIAAGSVFINGQRCRVASRLVTGGTRLRVALAAAEAEPTSGLIEILFDDGGCIAVNKPAGMPSAPTQKAAAGSAQDALRQQLRNSGRPAQLWSVHRLDQATSGVLLFASTRPAATALSEAFRSGAVRKEYLALVSGAFAAEQGTIELAIHNDTRRARVDPSGRPARTDWQVVERRDGFTLLRLHPLTGRMHQLRVHLQAIGHAIVGDPWYGGPAARRLMLHAASLSFPLPGSGRLVTIEAPLPVMSPN